MSRTARLLLFALASVASWVTVVGELRAEASAGAHHIGVVATSVSEQSEEADAFRQGLRELGYVEGSNISITWWHGHGSSEHAPEAVDDLLKRKVDLFVVESTRAGLAAKRATSQIPIVMALVGDPVESPALPPAPAMPQRSHALDSALLAAASPLGRSCATTSKFRP